MKKLLFVDTNVFVDCVFQQVEMLDCKPLDDFLDKLENNLCVLIMPEIIERETFFTLSKTKEGLDNKVQTIFSDLSKIQSTDGHSKESRLIPNALEESKNICLKKIADAHSDGIKVFKKILGHRNTKKIKLTNDLMINGLRRSLFKIPPFSLEVGKRPHTKDQDCIAFESLLFFLRSDNFKNFVLIACINDSDYHTTKKGLILKPEILADLKTVCKDIKSYKNPLSVLSKEFSAAYEKKDIDSFSTLVAGVPLTVGVVNSVDNQSLSNGFYAIPSNIGLVVDPKTPYTYFSGGKASDSVVGLSSALSGGICLSCGRFRNSLTIGGSCACNNSK